MKALRLTCFFFLLFSSAYLLGAIRLPFGTAAQPGAGLFPFVLAAILIFLSLGLVVFSFKKSIHQKEIPEGFPRGVDLARVTALTVILICFPILLKSLGFIFCSALVLVATFKVFGLKSWVKAFLIGGLAASSLYYLFSHLLEVPLPLGTIFS